MAKLTKTQKSLLEVILEQLSTAAYTFASAVDVNPLVDGGFLIADPNGPNVDGLVAVAIPSQTAGEPIAEPSAPVDEPANEVAAFAIEDGIPVPARVRKGGGQTEVYPFSKLAPGQSFFVASAGKSLRSTVSAATRRYAVASDTETRTNRKGATVPVLKATRTFQLFLVVAGQKYANGFIEKADGSRVFRTA